MDPTNEDVEIIPEIEYCTSGHMLIFAGVIYAYKGFLMVSPYVPATVYMNLGIRAKPIS